MHGTLCGPILSQHQRREVEEQKEQSSHQEKEKILEFVEKVYLVHKKALHSPRKKIEGDSLDKTNVKRQKYFT
jgi:hypothetical protein